VRSNLLKTINSKRTGKGAIGAAGVSAAVAAINGVFDSHMPKAAAAVLHGLSDFEARKALTSLNEAKNQAAQLVKKECADIERWAARLAVIDRNLAQIPADEALAPRVEAIAELQRRLGALEQAKVEAEERLKRFEIDAEQARRELRRLTERYQAAGEASAKITLARTVQSALSDYLRELTIRKVDQLRDAVASCFNRLSRKGDLVARVEIDPRTFVVTLFDKAGTAVPKDELSSGEKQMFAIAMLWGLAKTSGRPLPVIIDTPLGRLDSDHRRKLIHDYLPFASHQVIVLSTDTEVDQALFEELRPDISHAYHLVFGSEDRRTEVSTGYFWKSSKEVPCLT
jgi:DNA sulfur modification protein DndD